jgi:hypothetical protein
VRFEEWLLLGVTGLSLGVASAYYASNHWLRQHALRSAGRTHYRMELSTSFGLLGFGALLGMTAFLGPWLAVQMAREPITSSPEATFYFSACIGAALLAAAGAGIHAAGRSIEAVGADYPLPPEMHRTIRLFHGPFGHYTTHLGLSIFTAAATLVAAAHAVAEADGPSWLLVVAGALAGLMRAGSVVDGGTWRAVLPAESLLTLGVIARVASLAPSPVVLFWVACLAAGPVGLCLWWVLHGGLPAVAPRRDISSLQSRAVDRRPHARG